MQCGIRQRQITIVVDDLDQTVMCPMNDIKCQYTCVKHIQGREHNRTLTVPGCTEGHTGGQEAGQRIDFGILALALHNDHRLA